ncbi:hypothetical protein JHK87_052428 [Glycine soja]|nr:hypothetical protein JHK86_052346 [Glycine max]KAG4914871.1 hypothetical protein JHK87_052428 [Glycine soja]
MNIFPDECIFCTCFFQPSSWQCLRHKYPILEVSRLGLLVLGTFAAVWWPYLYSTQSILEI